ncbi:hypothetical protein AS29_013290 [Bacillus sp. SJS]|nr:hypothetical protein AS29_013290 [Bacillus sp. SJS]
MILLTPKKNTALTAGNSGFTFWKISAALSSGESRQRRKTTMYDKSGSLFTGRIDQERDYAES